MDLEFQTYLNKERDKINKIIYQVFDSSINSEEEPLLRKFYKYASDYVLRGGRRTLPICFINTFGGLSSDKDIVELSEEIYLVSVSVELLHIASLVIDDLVDQEDLRSGFPTFHKFLGQNISDGLSSSSFEQASAIYGGNIISYLGAEIISKSKFDGIRKSKALSLYNQGLQGITRGHLLNEYYKLLPLEKISLENYLILADLKRGKQMETAVGIGALLGNARKSQEIPLMQAMNKLGIIEQLINDYNGSFGDPKKKSISRDITNGQSTILTVIAFQGADSEQRSILNRILGDQNATEDEIQSVRDIFVSTGATDFVKYYANSLKNDVYNNLQKIYPGLRKEIMIFYEHLLGHVIEFEDNL